MNLLKRVVVSIMAVSTILIWSNASAGNPFETEEFEDSGFFYIDCLNEWVTLDHRGSLRWREFETPSGNFHFLETASWEGEWFGNSSSQTWYTRGVYHVGEHMGPNEIIEWTVNMIAKPVSGDGPKLKMYTVFKFIVDANGEIRAEIGTEWNQVRCFGAGG
jgi:hypothetical protein